MRFLDPRSQGFLSKLKTHKSKHTTSTVTYSPKKKMTTLQFGILSTANIAVAMVAHMHQCEATSVLAVASRNLPKAQEFAQANNIPRAYGSYDELLRDEGIQAIYIPLPTSHKTEWAIKAANAGKHVLCDKPIASASDVQKILEACRNNGVHFMDNTMFVHGDINVQIKSHELSSHMFPSSGNSGALQRVNSSLSFHLGDSSNIRLNKELEPQGAIGDLAWYNVRNILWAYGYEKPVSVQATALFDEEHGVPVRCDAWISFSGNRIATFNCSFRETKRQVAEYVTVDHTVLHLSFMSDEPAQYLFDGTPVEAKVNKPRIINLLDRFVLDAANPESKESKKWGEETLLNMIVLDAVMQSAVSGKVVSL